MNELTNFANPVQKPETFDQIQIGLASPERIRSWSYLDLVEGFRLLDRVCEIGQFVHVSILKRGEYRWAAKGGERR